MSAISEFADRVEAKHQEISDSTDVLVSSINGIDGDVQNLKKIITDFQNSPGAITPEDQERLNKLESGLVALSAKTSAAIAQAKALDEQTAEVPTPTPS